MYFIKELNMSYDYQSDTLSLSSLPNYKPLTQKRRFSCSFLRHQQIKCLLSIRSTILLSYRYPKKVIWPVLIALVLTLLTVLYASPYPYLPFERSEANQKS
jgi:hypothetical protein